MNQRLNKDSRNLELVTGENEGAILGDLNTYIPKLMNNLYEQPKLVVSIIQRASINDLKNHLAPFFANNFYENILSSYYIEDNLMYVLTSLIKSEIDSLNGINQNSNFLEETPCGILLGELRRKSDIQAYFNNIIKNAIEDLEANNSTYRIDFETNKMINFYQNLGPKIENDVFSKTRTSGDNSNNNFIDEELEIDKKKKQSQIDQEQFNRMYTPNLDIRELNKIIEKNKDDKDKYDYLTSILSRFDNADIFTNGRLFNHLNKYKHPENFLYIYQKHFMIAINFIDRIIKNILENFHLVPYSIKCICRIISELVSKKFPTISFPDKSVFIAKFFFGKLLIPILLNPGVEAFINNFISQNSLYNLQIIAKILNKYISGTFYTDNDIEFNYTPFNWYFLHNINDLYTIFKKTTKVLFPSFIENFVNNKLPPDYEYDYFKENPDEVVNFRSILYNMDQVTALIETMDKNKAEFFVGEEKNKKIRSTRITIQKLTNEINQGIIKNIIDSEKLINKEKEKKIAKGKDKKKQETEEKVEVKQHYFLVTRLDSNESYTKLLNISKKPNFKIEEMKETKNDEDMVKNNIIRVKNFFFSLLFNYHKLVKTDFDEGTTENTKTILEELNLFMKSSNFVMDGTIPFEWLVKSILEYLKKLPDYLTKNDCEELYNEMERDINKSIKEYDFEALSVIMGKLNFAYRSLLYYQNNLKLLEDIKFNEQIRKIINEFIIPVDIKFFYNDGKNKDIFSIEKSKIKEKDINSVEKIDKYERNNKIKLSTTIASFPKKFPNLNYQENNGADIFNIQKNLNFPKQIDKYISIVDEYLKKENVDDIEKMKEQIFHYIMGKIYDKIYPIEYSNEDNKIFQKSVLLSWTQPKHFIKEKKELIFGNFEKDCQELFKLLDIEKSPRKKLINLGRIFSSIIYLLSFNGKKEIGVDDQLPVLNYAAIKAKSLRMNSNARFMRLYIGDLENKNEGNQLSNFETISKFIQDIDYTKLYGVSQEEFNANNNKIVLVEKK